MRLIAAIVFAILICLPANASSLDAIESKLFTLPDLKLDSGATLPEATSPTRPMARSRPTGGTRC